jgi:hypothetical protein
MNKPKCFTDHQWSIYKAELQMNKGSKKLDVCFDCTKQYQSSMRRESRCEFPMKRIDKIAEFR